MNDKRIPCLTMGVALGAILAGLLPEAADLLTYDRARIAAGEYWRLLSGHLTHWNVDHLVWDVVMFAVLGVMIELVIPRRRFAALLLSSAAAISAGLWIWQPEFAQYRGLSGLDSALFSFAGLMVFHDARGQRQLPLRLAIVGLALGFVAKVAWELTTGSTVFVDAQAGGFVPLPLVHAIGAGTGVLAFVAAQVGARPARSPHVTSTGRLPEVAQPGERAAVVTPI